MPRDDMLFPKTIHDVKTSRDINRLPLTTPQQAFRKRKLVYPVSQADQAELAIELQRERRRFRKQTESLDRTRKRIERAREKLYAVRERNRGLLALRYQLQKERWASLSAPGAEQAVPQRALKRRMKEVTIRRR